MNQDFWFNYRIKADELSNAPKKRFADMNRRESRKYSKLIIGEIAFVIIVAITLLFS